MGRGDADPFVGTGTRMQGACVREAAGWAKQGDLARRGPEPFLQVCVAAEMFVDLSKRKRRLDSLESAQWAPSRADRGIGGVRPVAPPTWLVSNFLMRTASS